MSVKSLVLEEIINDPLLKQDGEDPKELYLPIRQQEYCYFSDAEVEYRIEDSMIETEIKGVFFLFS